MKGKQLLIWSLLLAPLFALPQSAEKACFSVPGGFYETSPVLELYPFYQQHHIRFTTNGNRPTAQSRLYTGPLLLDESLYSTSDIYTIQVAPEDKMFYPDSIQHCIVIRAAVFDANDNCISEVATNSYFIRSLGCDTHGLPAVSLCADSLDLFDYHQGIFVPGAFFDPLDPNWTGNYYQSGDAWERWMNIEFYELDNTGINQQAGLRTHGGNGRRFPQKCMKIYAREEYGKKRFDHRFFETIPNNSFKHLILKPFCASWLQSGVTDHVCSLIATRLNVETLASRPAVLYLNGEYWGIYYIHERHDERFIEDHFGYDLDEINLLSGWNFNVVNGSNQNMVSFYSWLEDADLSDPDNWNYVRTHVDVDCFIDYQILELFIENMDWPANNMRCWQLNNGPFRWIFYDGDGCLRYLSFDVFANALYVGSSWWPSSTRATLFFRKFLENDAFLQAFLSRFDVLLNTVFQDTATVPCLDAIATALENEVPLQSDRFGFPESMDRWNHDIAQHRYFLLRRVENMREKLNLFIGMDEDTNLYVVYPNPFKDYLIIQSTPSISKHGELQIFNMLGQMVYAQSYAMDISTNTIRVDVALPPGLYFLKMDNAVTKIVRQ